MASSDPNPWPLRIEQELHVLDAVTLLPAARAAAVLGRLPGVEGVMPGGAATVVGLRTPLCPGPEELRRELARLRGALIGVARAEGCALASCGRVGGSEVSARLRVLDADGVQLSVRDALASLDDVVAVAVGRQVPDVQACGDGPWLRQIVDETARDVPVTPVIRRPRSAMDPDEHRLRAEVPPHHG